MKKLTLAYLSYQTTGKELLMALGERTKKRLFQNQMISFFKCLSGDISHLEGYSPDVIFIDLSHQEFLSLRFRVRYLLKWGPFKDSKVVWLFRESEGAEVVQNYYTEVNYFGLADHSVVSESFHADSMDTILEALSLTQEEDHLILEREAVDNKKLVVGSIGDVVMYTHNFVYIESDLILKKGDKLQAILHMEPYDKGVDIEVFSKFDYTKGRFSNTYIFKIEHENDQNKKQYIDSVIRKCGEIPLRTVRVLGLSEKHPLVAHESPESDYFHEMDSARYMRAVIERAPQVIGFEIKTTDSEEWNKFLSVLYAAKNLNSRPRIIVFSHLNIKVERLRQEYPKLEFVKGDFDYLKLAEGSRAIHSILVNPKGNPDAPLNNLYQADDTNLSGQCQLLTVIESQSVTQAGMDFTSESCWSKPTEVQLIGSEGVLPPMKIVSVNNGNGHPILRGYWQMVNDPSQIDTEYIRDIFKGLPS